MKSIAKPVTHLGKPLKTIAIVTAIDEAWGGCEELWSRSVPLLQGMGHAVVVFKSEIQVDHPRISAHISQGVKFYELTPRRPLLIQLIRKAIRKWRNYWKGDQLPGFLKTEAVASFASYLSEIRPDMVLVSQGINFDGMGYAHVSNMLQIPYVIVAHKAVDFFWPPPVDRRVYKTLLLGARACYFVSKHNLRLTEEQFGVKLLHGSVLFNPVKLTTYIEYPSVSDGFRLCCIGRLFISDKGQDMLLRVLSKQQWKERPVQVTFIGDGQDKEALIDLSHFLGVTNVGFAGFLDDMAEVWRQHHALILPSRCEGLPLTIVEAMYAGRPVITTDAGGNAEFLKEGITGFIGQCNEISLGEAMERAWNRRADWPQMGKHASKEIVNIIPEAPERNFVEMLLIHL